MYSATTLGVTVTVECAYIEEHSVPRGHKFVFGYQISIRNNSPHTLQLLRRKWHIMDGDGSVRVVEGDGVVGQQPILRPGDTHVYQSFCNLFTEIGKMRGFFTMENRSNRELFYVEIPAFEMFAPSKSN